MILSKAVGYKASLRNLVEFTRSWIGPDDGVDLGLPLRGPETFLAIPLHPYHDLRMDNIITSPVKRPPGKPKGRHPHKRLSAALVRSAPPGQYCDGNGLQKTGTRSWIQRLVIRAASENSDSAASNWSRWPRRATGRWPTGNSPATAVTRWPSSAGPQAFPPSPKPPSGCWSRSAPVGGAGPVRRGPVESGFVAGRKAPG